MTQSYRDPEATQDEPEKCSHGMELRKAAAKPYELASMPSPLAPQCEQCFVVLYRAQWIRKRVEEWSVSRAAMTAVSLWEAAEALYEEGKKRGHLR